jgi:hypothetical protein
MPSVRASTFAEDQWQLDLALNQLGRDVLGVLYGPYERFARPVMRWNAHRLARRYLRLYRREGRRQRRILMGLSADAAHVAHDASGDLG